MERYVRRCVCVSVRGRGCLKVYVSVKVYDRESVCVCV